MACVPTSIPGDKPTDLAPFTYTPLGPSQHTRILRLEASVDPKAPLRCSLQPVDLDTYPDYEALSYTWGPPDFTESLMVEQSGHSYRLLKITPNLHHGLQRLRTAVTTRYLWVDAVCINQNDDKDKAVQIPRMAQIYRQASSVIIWLGEHADGAECLARLSKATRRPHDELQLADIRKDCDGLYSIPWFRRRWIIQEAVLNDDATILCGDFSTSITRMIRAFSEFEHGFPVMHKIAELRRGRIWNQPISNDIMTLLDSFDEAECSNDLDRLYAIAGLSGDMELVLMKDQRQEHLPIIQRKILLPVNYEQDAKSLYCSFARALLKHYEAMSLFTKILVCASTRLQSPGSWFPCWNMPIVLQPLQQPPEKIFSQSSTFADNFLGGSVHQIVSCRKLQVISVTDPELDATEGGIGPRVADLSIPCPAVCTASELCTWIQSVFRDIGRWAEAVRAYGRGTYDFPSDNILLITLLGVMTDWHCSQQHFNYYTPDPQNLEIFKSICLGTKSVTEFDENQSPLREITRTMRGRRIVNWDSHVMKYSVSRDDGGTQNARLADAGLDDLANPLHNSQLFYQPRPTPSFRIGIAPDFTNINDELIVERGEQSDDRDVGRFSRDVRRSSRDVHRSSRDVHRFSRDVHRFSDSTFAQGSDLYRGFVLRLSHEQCDYGHKEVPHYNLIGECAVVDISAHERRYYARRAGIEIDMCLH